MWNMKMVGEKEKDRYDIWSMCNNKVWWNIKMVGHVGVMLKFDMLTLRYSYRYKIKTSRIIIVNVTWHEGVIFRLKQMG